MMERVLGRRSVERAGRRISCTNANINGTPTELLKGGVARKVLRCRRTMSTITSFQQATKPSKTLPKKTQRSHLEYKSPTRKPPPPPNRSSAGPKQQQSNPLRHRTIPIVFGSVTLFALSGYCTYLYTTFARVSRSPSRSTAQADVSSRYDSIASTFDSSVDWTEYIMGITALRRKLAAEARGDVLEVSIGTGRNLSFYDWDFRRGAGGGDGRGGGGKVVDERRAGSSAAAGVKKGKVRSFTAVDKSPEMLEIAHGKFSAMFPGIVGVRWIAQDAGEEIPGPPRNSSERSGSLEGKKYDTVIQTMGLCSAADPVRVLKNLGECVEEDEGRILLLEHGRGRWAWLNDILDKSAEGHAQQFGCWWNRDLGEIVAESALEIVKLDRKHGGTTWWIELRKPRSPEREDSSNEVGNGEEEQRREESKKKAWW